MALRTRLFRVKLVLGVFAALTAVCLLVGARWFSLHDTTSTKALGPLSLFALPASQRLRFEGRVVERMSASSYVYLLVERAGGQRSWVVTLASSAGARVSAEHVKVLAMGYAEHFDSKRLARSFDGLYFAVVRPYGPTVEMEH